jgi:hypothetical protein
VRTDTSAGRYSSAIVSRRLWSVPELRSAELSDLSFGRCACRAADLELRTVLVGMTVNDQRVELSDVPQGACDVCGARVYKAAILHGMEEAMRGRGSDQTG